MLVDRRPLKSKTRKNLNQERERPLIETVAFWANQNSGAVQKQDFKFLLLHQKQMLRFGGNRISNPTIRILLFKTCGEEIISSMVMLGIEIYQNQFDNSVLIGKTNLI